MKDNTKNLCFLDLETTGVETATDRIVEICIIKVNPNFEVLEKRTKKINPGIPIPKGASDVHGITDEMVKDEPTFSQLAKAIHEFISGCDIIGYNSTNFDAPMLYCEFERAGIKWDFTSINFIDACTIFKIQESRTLTAAVKFYLDKDHEEAHGAEADVLATIDVFQKQLDRYDLRGKTSAELARYSNYDRPILDLSGKFTMNPEGEIIFNFGVHKGKKAITERSYLTWMLRSNFASDTIAVITKILQ